MQMLWICAGIALVALTLWDVFNDLFHPASHGALGVWIARRLFELLRGRRGSHSLAGPLAVICIILAWVSGLVIGFALIYYNAFPNDFRTSTGAIPPANPHLLSVIYFSFQTLITLGYGDVIPMSQPIRFLASTEALIGFGLLTASISSVVLLYPALARMRLLARSIAQTIEAQRRAGISIADAQSDTSFSSLTQLLTQTRIDLIHFPLIYYFSTLDEDASLPKWMNAFDDLAKQGIDADCARVRIAGHALDVALQNFATLLAERFIPNPPREREQIFEAFVHDHGTRA